MTAISKGLSCRNVQSIALYAEVCELIGSILSTAVTAVGTATLAPTQAAARIETLGDC